MESAQLGRVPYRRDCVTKVLSMLFHGCNGVGVGLGVSGTLSDERSERWRVTSTFSQEEF